MAWRSYIAPDDDPNGNAGKRVWTDDNGNFSLSDPEAGNVKGPNQPDPTPTTRTPIPNTIEAGDLAFRIVQDAALNAYKKAQLAQQLAVEQGRITAEEAKTNATTAASAAAAQAQLLFEADKTNAAAQNAQNQFMINTGIKVSEDNNANRLAIINILKDLKGPRNAFVQQSVIHGLNAAGLSRAVDAISGRASLPGVQGDQAAPEPMTLQSFLDDTGAMLPGEIKMPTFSPIDRVAAPSINILSPAQLQEQASWKTAFFAQTGRAPTAVEINQQSNEMISREGSQAGRVTPTTLPGVDSLYTAPAAGAVPAAGVPPAAGDRPGDAAAAAARAAALAALTTKGPNIPANVAENTARITSMFDTRGGWGTADNPVSRFAASQGLAANGDTLPGFHREDRTYTGWDGKERTTTYVVPDSGGSSGGTPGDTTVSAHPDAQPSPGDLNTFLTGGDTTEQADTGGGTPDTGGDEQPAETLKRGSFNTKRGDVTGKGEMVIPAVIAAALRRMPNFPQGGPVLPTPATVPSPELPLALTSKERRSRLAQIALPPLKMPTPKPKARVA